jgi:hypothetical protein
MNKTSDIQETADDLNNHPMVAMEDRKMDEISRAAQNTLNDGQRGTETGQINPESKAKTLRSKGGAFLRWPIVVDNSADLCSSSLSGSASFPCACGILLLRK